MAYDGYFGPHPLDRARLMAGRAWALLTFSANRWVPPLRRLKSFPAGQRTGALQALADARTAREVRRLLRQEDTLTPEFLQDMAARCGALTPAMARWLVTVQPVTAEGLAVNGHLSADAARAAARVLQRVLTASTTCTTGWARVLEALLAMECQRPGLIKWTAGMQRTIRRHADPVNVRPGLWRKLAACAHAPVALVHATWPRATSWVYFSPPHLAAVLNHPRRAPDASAEVVRSLQEPPTRDLTIAVVRAAGGEDRRPWWRAAFMIRPELTLQLLAEEYGAVDGGRSLDGVFTHEDLAAHLSSEDAAVRLATICLLQHVRSDPAEESAPSLRTPRASDAHRDRPDRSAARPSPRR